MSVAELAIYGFVLGSALFLWAANDVNHGRMSASAQITMAVTGLGVFIWSCVTLSTFISVRPTNSTA